MMPESEPPLRFEVAGNIALLTLNRPAQLNAIDGSLRAALRAAWHAVETRAEIRVAILTAAGDRAFSAGADVRKQAARHQTRDPRTEPVGPSGITPRQAGVTKPVICAVNGLCAGGALQFISDADIVIAAEHATFTNPGVSLGLIAPYGPIGLLRRGPAEPVFRLMLMGRGERISAWRAYELGWVSAVVPAAALQTTARELAERIATADPAYLAQAKQALWACQEQWLAPARGIHFMTR